MEGGEEKRKRWKAKLTTILRSEVMRGRMAFSSESVEGDLTGKLDTLSPEEIPGASKYLSSSFSSPEVPPPSVCSGDRFPGGAGFTVMDGRSSVGVAVGLSVSVAMGLSVGVAVGSSAGVAVGLPVGAAVGLPVGVAVGLPVDAMVSKLC